MLLILVGQNLQGRHSKGCAKSDSYVNVKAENEIEIILLHLENQNQLILKILRHVEARENSELKKVRINLAPFPQFSCSSDASAAPKNDAALPRK